MTKVIMHGCNGKMGQVIAKIIDQDKDIEIVAGVDVSDVVQCSFPVYKSISSCKVAADVIIDFSSAGAIDNLLDYCEKSNIPLVLCTTGLSEAQIRKVETISQSVAILRSANMSLGINLLLNILKEAAGVLAPAGYDIEIVEKHHNQKIDAPSGTALALADSINEELDNRYTYVFDRSSVREKRSENEIGISSIRGGTIVGDHDVIFAGEDEVITFSHTAYSKAILAKGAVQAAKFLSGKSAGLYSMQDVIKM